MKLYSVFLTAGVAIIRILTTLWIRQFGDSLTEILHWDLQFCFLVGISLITAYSFLKSRKTITRILLMLFDLFLIIVSTYPFQKSPFLLILLFSHYWLVLYKLDYKILIPYVVFTLLATQLFEGDSLIAGQLISGLSWSSRIELFFGELFSVIILYVLNRIGIQSDKALDDREFYEQNMTNLLEINLDLQNYAISERNQVRLDERKRIAQELHDTLMHSLLNLKMAGESMRDQIPEENTGLKRLLGLSEGILNGIWDNIENEIYDIRNRTEKEKEGLNRLHDMVRTFEEATQISVQIEYSNFPQTLGQQTDRIIYRVIQEGLTNAFRHGKADNILILLWQESESYRLVVRDNGQGSKKGNENGMGLWGIQQRLSAVNGSVEFNSSSIGFEISATIPRNRSYYEKNETVSG